jgi:hypothetical protein
LGPRPTVYANGDFDGDCDVDKDDFNAIISYLFSGSPLPVPCTCIRPKTLYAIPGDADNSGAVDVSDAVRIVEYIFSGGFIEPYTVMSGDANCDCTVDISDVVYLINYIFGGGPAPCDWGTWESLCGTP